MFETGQFWFESLQILDYVLGVPRHPIAEEAWLSINSRNDRRQIEAAVVKPAFPKYRRYSVRREGDSVIRIMKL